MKGAMWILFLLLLCCCKSGYSQEKDSAVSKVEWPMIAGYQKILPLGKLRKNAGNFDGFFAGFQFPLGKKAQHIIGAQLSAAWGGDRNNPVLFYHEGEELETYIKEIYGLLISYNRFFYVIPDRFLLTTNAGIGYQKYGSGAKVKVLDKTTIPYRDKYIDLESGAPLLNAGVGLRYKIKKFWPLGVQYSFNYAPSRLFSEKIERGIGGSYGQLSIYTGFFIPAF